MFAIYSYPPSGTAYQYTMICSFWIKSVLQQLLVFTYCFVEWFIYVTNDPYHCLYVKTHQIYSLGEIKHCAWYWRKVALKKWILHICLWYMSRWCYENYDRCADKNSLQHFILVDKFMVECRSLKPTKTIDSNSNSVAKYTCGSLSTICTWTKHSIFFCFIPYFETTSNNQVRLKLQHALFRALHIKMMRYSYRSNSYLQSRRTILYPGLILGLRPQWKTSLLSNAISHWLHWLGANLESTLISLTNGPHHCLNSKRSEYQFCMVLPSTTTH